MKALLRFALVAGALLTAVVPAHAQKYKSEYRMSTYVGNAFQLGQGAERWIELVKERTEGRINIKMYPGSSLVGGDGTREFSGLRQGSIDLNVGSVINLAPNVKELNLFLLPFFVQDEAAFDALIHGRVGEELFKRIEKRGVVPLAWGENGFREVSNSKRPIRTPADLEGLKIRVVGSPIFTDIFRELGANPTQMTFSDLQPALQNGAVDGQENPMQYFLYSKMPQFNQKYLTRWAYMSDALVFSVSKRTWDSWTPEDQEIVRQAALDAAKFEIAEARKGLHKPDDFLIQEAISAGTEVTTLTPEERAAFAEATRPVLEKWTKVVGEDLVNMAREDILASRKN